MMGGDLHRETTVDSKQVLMQTAQSSSHYLSHKGTRGALDGKVVTGHHKILEKLEAGGISL